MSDKWKIIRFSSTNVLAIVLILLVTALLPSLLQNEFFSGAGESLGYVITITVKIIVTIFFVIIPFTIIVIKIYKWEPVKRDRFLFARSGWGMALYSGVAIVLVVSFICAIANIWVGDSHDIYSEDDVATKHTLVWNVISQFADPGNLPHSRGFGGTSVALISAFAGILCLSGLVVSSLVSMISRRTQQWRDGRIHYTDGFKNYVVIIGSNEQTATIIKGSLRESGVEYILVQTRKDVEKERARIELRLERDDEKRVVFYYGDRALEEDVKALQLEKAREVYILGEDMRSENEQDHDAYNISCLEHISKYMEEHQRAQDDSKRLRCHVNFEYQSTFMAFKFTHLYRGLNETIEFLPFNVHEIWAKKVFVDTYAVVPSSKNSDKKIIDYLPLDTCRRPIGGNDASTKYIQYDTNQSVHLVVIGMNQMGVALAMQAALLVHLPNFHRDNSYRTTISFVDNDAIREGEFLRGRYDALFSLCRYREIVVGRDVLTDDDADTLWKNPLEKGRYSFMRKDVDAINENFMDIQWEFIEGNVASPDIREYLATLTENECKTTTIAVCFNNPQQSIATALYLPETVLKRSLQILVYQQNTMDMIDKIATSEREWKRYGKLRPFGMIEGCYTVGMFDSKLAKFANMAYADRDLTPDSPQPMEEAYRLRTDRLWDELGIVDKLSNIDLVDSLGLKLRSIGIDEYDDEKIFNALVNAKDTRLAYLAMAEHQRWLTERLTMGYRPLDEDELEKEKSNGRTGYRYSKEYYKNKRRAHLDICSNEDVLIRDKKAAERNMDRKIITMIYSLKKWSHVALLRDIFTGNSLPQYRSIIKDMERVGKIRMSCHNVTVGQWEMVMGTHPSDMLSSHKEDYITSVSWNDVQRFLKVIRKETGLPFDIPTQEEWNKAKEYESVIKDLCGTVWQWTKSNGTEYASSRVFCGMSKGFKESGWKDDSSYWLPNFTSKDLGFRLVLRCDYPQSIRENNFDAKGEMRRDDDKEISLMIRKMVRVEDNPSFRILPTPVTQRQWKAVMFTDIPFKERIIHAKHQGDYYPIENITFQEVLDFVTKLNEKYHGIGFRLPTNDEWKLAVEQNEQNIRTTDFDILSNDQKSLFVRSQIIWSNELAKSTREEPNYNDLPDDGTLIYDLFGNVWEWIGEKYDCDNGDITRRLHGGSWRFSNDECKRAGGSYWLKEGYKADDIGFRIVVSEEDYQKVIKKLDGNREG
ncbi:MAG: SUMF1/EgtB/PvdO family nonheme iron enzyme [Bacteroidales bacterium]|nr:SUMF1/EgtB/PvdO family nonheme iron enzyme [Bacteroidales bacterium]